MLVFNKKEWMSCGWFSENDIDSALNSEDGYLGMKYGMRCFVSKLILQCTLCGDIKKKNV